MEQKTSLKEKRDIRLLVDAHVFDGIFQGSRTFLKGVYSHLDTKKYNLKIFLAANDTENLKREFEGLPNIEFVKLKSTNKYARLAIEIPRLIKELQIDFAHLNYYLPLFLNKNCQYIITIHDVLFLDYPQYFPKAYILKNKSLFGWAAKRAEILNTVSHYSAGRIKKNFDLGNKEVSVLPNAIDEKFFMPRSKEKDRGYLSQKYGISNFLLFVSRWEPRKNHMAVLKAYDELKLWEQGIDLVFIGKKALKNPELDTYVEELKMKSNNKIQHISYIPQEELLIFNNAALISIFPSLCEGFGIPPLESAALKTPTICSNLTAMKEFDFFEKYHVNPQNQKELIQAIDRMLKEIKDSTISSHLESVAAIIHSKYKWDVPARVLGESLKNKHEK